MILSAAKADAAISQLYSNIPTGLIPVNGKPVISHIIKNFTEVGIQKIYVSVGYEKEKLINYAKGLSNSKIEIEFVETDPTKGAGDSLKAILGLTNESQVLISVADTIFDFSKLDFSQSFVIASEEYYESERWCLVEAVNGKVLRFIDKQFRKESTDKSVLIGIYYLDKLDHKKIENLISEDNLQISDILNLHKVNNEINVEIVDEWIDVGHIDNYYKAKQKLLSTRFFNSLEVNRLFGTVTKRSGKSEKFVNEINWQLNLPKNISVLFPRIIDHSIDKENAFVTMEYYGYPNVAELWLYGSLSPSFSKHIIGSLISVLDIFSNEKKEVSEQSYKMTYVDKTEERLVDLIKLNPVWEDILSQSEIDINGEKLPGWKAVKEKIYQLCESLYDINHNCLIHGDFCLSNILYDMNNGVFRLIDPRGKWGENEYGDIKYDVAKLRHSVCGDYDYIVNDLFEVTRDNFKFDYHLIGLSELTEVKEYFDKTISEKYDLNQILLIEGLLFLSMLPLHNDSFDRQMVMFCKSIEKFSKLDLK